MRLAFVLASCLIVLLALAAACGDDSSEPSGPYIETRHFTRAGHDVTLNTEVADEPGERAQGLMNRQSLPDDAGMLFVWPADTQSGFWMRDTVIPLSIAFVTAGGVVSDIQDMEPLSEVRVRAPQLDVVDACAAGAVLSAGYLYGLLKGWSMDACLRFAVAASSLSCTDVGPKAFPIHEVRSLAASLSVETGNCLT